MDKKSTIFRFLKLCFIAVLLTASALPAEVGKAEQAPAPVNLALNQAVSYSSQYSGGQARWAVDGDSSTSWVQLSADKADGEVWLSVDLGTSTEVRRAVMQWSAAGVNAYKIQYSDDNSNWSDAYTSTEAIANQEQVNFAAVTARYIRLWISGSADVQEFELYAVEGDDSGEEPESNNPGPDVNLALNKTVGYSSQFSGGQARWAVDGDNSTSWVQLSADKADGEVWLSVDLGMNLAVNKFHLNWGSLGVQQYKIQYSHNGTVWLDAYHRLGLIEEMQTIVFEAVEARYVRLWIAGSANVAELELYYSPDEPLSPDIGNLLRNIVFIDEQHNEYAEDEAVELAVHATLQVHLRGYQYLGGEADLSTAEIAYTSLNPDIAVVDQSGLITGIKSGIARIQANASSEDATHSRQLYIQVVDSAERIAELKMTHSTHSFAIGQPALIDEGDQYPTVDVAAGIPLTIQGSLIHDGTVIHTIAERAVEANESYTITIAGETSPGMHELQLRLTDTTGNHYYDSFFFTVPEPDWTSDQLRQLVFASGSELISIPDHKGNRVMDFSNSGYGGGGASIPDVPIQLRLQPETDGDDTLRIQAAIDEVSALPADDAGFRGTVLLEAGTYRVAGTLNINQSGVVLRGEGEEDDGTVVIATGKEVRPLIDVQGSSGPILDEASSIVITDLYVPAGSRSFHVDNAEQLQTGDKVMVRRGGNDHWIHEIRMDRITDRPGSSPGETASWDPFDIDFDRVITGIEGNLVTVDAPLASSIEWKWGGGRVIPYTDSGRIAHVGIENMKLMAEFDPSVMSSHAGELYYSDEEHANDAIVIDRTVNAWVRNIAAHHFYSGLTVVGREAKWITIQDAKALHMVSVITGGRRSPISLFGSLTLAQRIYTETARHAFAVQSRVPGPNVFLDSISVNEFGASEPHHRWSVGGLYDNVEGRIAIQDRAWLGTGQGWSGANYVTWNTKGDLIIQQSPTAQNYSIGHVGTFGIPFVPNNDDPYPRSNGYIEHVGAHVEIASLYLAQLEARLGRQAVDNIAYKPIEDTYRPEWQEGMLHAANISSRALTLSWSGANDPAGIESYKLYKNGELIAETTASSYTVDNLAAGSGYLFKVEAGNAQGWWSTDGPVLSVQTTDNACSVCNGVVVIPPADTGVRQLFTLDDVRRQPDTGNLLVMDKDKTEAQLDRNTVEAIGGLPLTLQFGEATVRLPSSLLQEVLQRIDTPGAGVIIAVLSAEDIDDKPVAGLTISGAAYDLQIRLTDASGTERQWLTESGEAIKLTLPYDPSWAADERRLGVYGFGDESGWVYLGGDTSAIGYTITASVPQSGRFAVGEYNRQFVDVSSDHWASESISIMAARHIVKGVSDASFEPDRSVSRAEFAALLARMLQLEEADKAPEFSDVNQDAWYAADIAAAFANGLISGVAPDRFEPDAPISREQMAAMLVRAYASTMIESSVESSPSSEKWEQPEDWEQASPWAKEEVAHVLALGLMKGKSAALFEPLSYVTRAEAAQALYNMLNKMRAERELL